LLSRSYDSALSFSHNDTLLATWDLGGNCSGSVRIRRSRGATARCWGGPVEHEDRLFLRGKRAITKDSENQTSAAGASPRVLRAPQGCTSFAPYVNAPPLDRGAVVFAPFARANYRLFDQYFLPLLDPPPTPPVTSRTDAGRIEHLLSPETSGWCAIPALY
jgi:hypothetical protein